MLLHQLNKEKGTLHLEPKDKLEKEDFESVQRELDNYLKDNRKIKGVLIKAPEFPGWKDIEGLFSHLDFVKEHHDAINRVAIVTEDSKVTSSAPAADAMVDAEVKTFALSDENIATEWVENG